MLSRKQNDDDISNIYVQYWLFPGSYFRPHILFDHQTLSKQHKTTYRFKLIDLPSTLNVIKDIFQVYKDEGEKMRHTHKLDSFINEEFLERRN